MLGGRWRQAPWHRLVLDFIRTICCAPPLSSPASTMTSMRKPRDGAPRLLTPAFILFLTLVIITRIDKLPTPGKPDGETIPSISTGMKALPPSAPAYRGRLRLRASTLILPLAIKLALLKHPPSAMK